MIQRAHAGIRWELQPDFAPLLERLLSAPGEVIKESLVKRVTRHELDGRSFFLKRYLYSPVPLRPLKYLVRPTQARQEWRIAQQLEARQMPVVRHLALGERRTWHGIQESVLITEGFAGKPLHQSADVSRTAVRAFVERLHERGVLQEDLHPANILVRPDPLEFRLVDLHGIRIVPALSPAEREHNLAVLRMTFVFPVSPAVEALSHRLRRSLWRARSHRSLRRNRDFAQEEAGGLAWQIRVQLLNLAGREVMAGPDRFLERAQVLKAGRTSTVGRGGGLVLKRFNLRKPENLFKDLFRPSRARRAFQAAYHLELAGIPTARPVAMASRRKAGFLLRSYLLMEEIAEAADLGKVLQAGPPDRKLIREAAELVARLHETGFSHRDLKEGNLVRAGNGRLYLLDLDGLSFHEEVAEARAAADLHRLALATAKYACLKPQHRTLFLLVYCRTRNLRRVPRRC